MVGPAVEEGRPLEKSQGDREGPHCRVLEAKLKKKMDFKHKLYVRTHFYLHDVFINLVTALLHLCHKSRFPHQQASRGEATSGCQRTREGEKPFRRNFPFLPQQKGFCSRVLSSSWLLLLLNKHATVQLSLGDSRLWPPLV